MSWKDTLWLVSFWFFTLSSLVVPGVADSYYGRQLCDEVGFKCITIKPTDTWEKLFPSEKQRALVKRLNRMNTPVNTRRWIVVPTNLSGIDYMDLAPFPRSVPSTGKQFLMVKLSLMAFGAYNAQGHLVFWGPVSGGKGWCPDLGRSCHTATGSFTVLRKGGANCVSTKFPIATGGGAPMPYCVYYFKGFALHGSTLPGYHASHGCVRLFREDAQWLNEQFLDKGSPVILMP